jgi:hypothetical protein
MNKKKKNKSHMYRYQILKTALAYVIAGKMLLLLALLEFGILPLLAPIYFSAIEASAYHTPYLVI